MGDDIKWLIGAIVGIVAMIGGFIVRDRQVMHNITNGDEKLHERINRMQIDFVRRDDLNGHIDRIEQQVGGMREEQRETNRRIDALITALTKKD